MGLAPTTLHKLRSQVSGPTGLRREGGCAAVAIRLALSSKQDPLAFGRRQIFQTWLDMLPAIVAEA
eukprot:7261244-Pyramimonas_sp.AAC.1